MTFDISDVIDGKGAGDWGIYVYDPSIAGTDEAPAYTFLYKGTPETGELIGTAFTSKITGQSAEFKIGNSIDFSFVNVAPEEGVTYTLVIKSKFNAVLSSKTGSAGTKYPIDYYNNPLVYTFIGEADAQNLLVVSSSVNANDNIEYLNDVTFKFDKPIQFVGQANQFTVTEGSTEVAVGQSVTVDPTDDCALTVNFGNVALPVTHTFSINMPEGVVAQSDNGDVRNKEIHITVNGAKYDYLEPVAILPESNTSAVPAVITAEFKMGADQFFRDSSAFKGSLYKVENGTETLVEEINSTWVDDRKIKWTATQEIMPETEYLFRVEKGTLSIYDTDYTSMMGYKKNNHTTNDLLEIRVTTPSEKNSGLSFKFSDPDTGDRSHILRPGSKVKDMAELNLELETGLYYFNGEGLRLRFLNLGVGEVLDKAKLYKETADGDVLVKEMNMVMKPRYDHDCDYAAINIAVNARMYEDIKYKVVIPASVISVNCEPLHRFLKNEEIVIEYIGTADSDIRMTCSSLREGERVNWLTNVALFGNQKVDLVDNTKRLTLQDSKGNNVAQAKYLMFTENAGTTAAPSYNTRIMADFSDVTDWANPKPFYLPETDDQYKLVVAAGTFSLSDDADITNKEMVINLQRIDDAGLPEYVSLTTVHSDHVAATVSIEKGLTARLQLTPDAYWKVDKLMFNDKDVTADVAEDGTYTTEALTADSRLEAKLAFDGELAVSESTDVPAVIADGVKVYSDGEAIVAEGVAAGTELVLYTVSGHVVKTHTAEKDIVRITAPTGTVYILRIGTQAAKVRH